MSWYEELNTYFPVDEMKSKRQFDALLSEKEDIYRKDEGQYHVLIYAEFETFIFIDFVWVSEKSRGKGIGHQLMVKLKAKNKPIILEVEPIDEDERDTEKRLRFYKREGFKHVLPIVYKHQDFIRHKETQLEILYWANSEVSERAIFEDMKIVYEQIHSYKVKEIYGYTPKPTSDVVRFEENRGLQNILL